MPFRFGNEPYYWLLLPIAVFCVYLLVISHIGFVPNDTTYLVSAGWRLLNGEHLYTDYIYARPPLSPLINAALLSILPEQGQLLRISQFSVMYYTTYIVTEVMLLYRFFPRMAAFAPFGLMLTLAMVMQMMSMRVMWHTADGIFFALFAIAALFYPKRITIPGIVTAALLTVISMAAKQSFYPLPFLLAFAVFFTAGWKKAFGYAAAVAALLAILIAAAYQAYPAETIQFFTQKQSQSQLVPFLRAGFLYYLTDTILALLFFPIPIALYLIFKRISFRPFSIPSVIDQFDEVRYRSLPAEVIRLLPPVIIWTYAVTLGYVIYFMLHGINYNPAIYSTHRLFFLFGTGISFWLIYKRMISRHQFFGFFSLMGLAWMASLSWGMMTPTLMVFPGFFMMLYAGNRFFAKGVSRYALYIIIALHLVYAFGFSAINGDTFEDLGRFSPKLEGMYSGRTTTSTYLSVARVMRAIESCPTDNYAVLPGATYVDWAHSKAPSLSLDWVSNVEMMRQKPKIMAQIARLDCVIIDQPYDFWEQEQFSLDINEVYKHAKPGSMIYSYDERFYYPGDPVPLH